MSVVIPVYNRAATIARAVRSVQRQTVGVEAIIVIDDGSTDTSGAVVLQLAADDPRIRYRRQTNAGAAAARNAGIEDAKSDWVAFLDSDDEWAPTKVANARAAVAADPDIEFLHSDRLLRRGSTIVEHGRATPADLASRDELLRGFLIKTSTVMIRKCLLQRLERWFPTALATCEDYELFWRAVAAGRAIGYVRSSDTFVELGADGLSRGDDHRAALVDNTASIMSATTWIATHHLPSHFVDRLRELAAREWRALILHDLQRGSYREAIRTTARCRKAMPAGHTLRAVVSATRGWWEQRHRPDR